MAECAEGREIMSQDNPFDGLEGELRQWADRVNEAAQLAGRCPEADRDVLIAMSDYLLAACQRLSFVLKDPRVARQSMTWKETSEHVRRSWPEELDAETMRRSAQETEEAIIERTLANKVRLSPQDIELGNRAVRVTEYANRVMSLQQWSLDSPLKEKLFLAWEDFVWARDALSIEKGLEK
jgi:hypothetical protein